MWWTLASAIVASATAIVIGVWLYPRQKQLDRVYELQRERREIYRRFARAYQPFIDATLNDETPDEEVKNNFEGLIEELLVSAPDDVAGAVIQFRFAARNWALEAHDGEDDDAWVLRGAMQECYEACLWAMRKDSFSDTRISSTIFEKPASSRLPPAMKIR